MLNLELWQTRFAEYMTLRQWSPRTVQSYNEILRAFFLYLESAGVESVSAVTRDTLEGFREYLFALRPNGKPLSMRTQSQKLGAVKAFTRFLLREQFILVDPGAGLDLPKVKKTVPRANLSEDEVARLVESPDVTTFLGLRNRAMLEVLYGAAVRNAELRQLQLDDVDFSRRDVRQLELPRVASR